MQNITKKHAKNVINKNEKTKMQNDNIGYKLWSV